MKLWSLIRCLLTVLAVFGLTVAPFARPATAADMPRAAATEAQNYHASDGEIAVEMAAGMPCCPDEMPVPDCAKDCPLMAICMAGVLQYVPFASSLLLPPTLATVLAPGDHAYLSRLGQAPPARPPKA